MHAFTTRSLGAPMLLAACAAAILGISSAAQAVFISYAVSLSGPNESPPNGSPGVGVGQVDIDTVAHTMHVQVTFSGLLGNTTVAHIHAATAVPGVGTAGVATQVPTFIGFPAGVTSGAYDNTFDMTLLSSYNPAYVAANGGTAASAEAALFASFANGTAYLNLHSSMFPGGEIRGFLLVPAPAAASLFAVFGLAARRRRTA